ncbi:MAG TPA: signal peptide peptidase SppA [Syntrophobacteraceae bacterium]|jgi:protease IV|nr:signal peptide peptidase SppA [Syntrophobacteraceae bacterium]HBD08246.1 signal peptide peptidase SppA [Syntrophobacteraceae bacterium]
MAIVIHVIAALLACSSCVKHQISFFSETDEPLKEYTLQGAGKEKILMIPVKGTISDSNKDLSLSRKPGMVQTIVSQLRKAEKDKNIKAVILEIDSPGGSVTASDMLYHEIVQFKERSGVKLAAVMMGVAASGGYYIALPSDFIWAHPTSITGSIGVIFLRPNLSGLMGKIGLQVEVDKSGKNKDMGSPFRKATGEEQHIVQGLIDEMAGRFLTLVATHRKLSDETKSKIASARIYAADDALRLGLVDQIGYLDDAIRKTAQLAGLADKPKVIVYRRSEVADDNLYNITSTSKPGIQDMRLIDLGLADSIPSLRSGFYYLWLPGQGE